MNSKEMVRKYADAVWNEKRLQAVDEMVHDQVHIHSLLGDFFGKEAMKQVVQAWLTAFPDLQVDEEQAIAEGELVSVQWRASGTHLGIFKGIQPTGNKVHYRGTTTYRVHQGHIVEYWAYLDMQHLTHQLVHSLNQVTLETDRMVLRSLQKDDEPLLRSFHEKNKGHLAKWGIYSDSFPMERWLKEGIEGRAVRFLLFQKNDLTTVVGMCNFTQIFHGPFKACYLGYMIGSTFERKGLMHEALHRAIGFIFDDLGLHRIMANYIPSNQRSANLLHRLGFKIEGHAQNYLMINGKWEDHVLTSLTAS